MNIEIWGFYPLQFASLEVEAKTNGRDRKSGSRPFLLELKLKKKSAKSGKQRSPVAPIVRGEMNAKARGELAELAFVLKAASLGFGVAKPHGENERYDFVVDSGQRLWKVQVKSSYRACRGGYQVGTGGNGQKTYTAEEIDFLVGYVAPRDIWYVLPVNCILLLHSLCFYPSGCNRGGGRFECYREAWHLMAPAVSVVCPSVRPARR
jgi:hypothetical protein